MNELKNTLIALGYEEPEIRQAIKLVANDFSMPGQNSQDSLVAIDLDEYLKKVLQCLSQEAA